MTGGATGIRQRPAAAMAQVGLRWAGTGLEVRPDRGLAHMHVRLRGENALALIHHRPRPANDARVPLMSVADSMLDPLAGIEAQAADLDGAQFDPAARRRMDAEIGRYRSLCAHSPRPPLCPTSFDAHPGNCMARADGRALRVDLERCRCSHASLAAARAMLLTSATWDAASSAALSVDEVAGATRSSGEDWPTELSEPAPIAHVRGRVDHGLRAIAEQVPGEIDSLAQALPNTDDQDAVIIDPHRP